MFTTKAATLIFRRDVRAAQSTLAMLANFGFKIFIFFDIHAVVFSKNKKLYK